MATAYKNIPLTQKQLELLRDAAQLAIALHSNYAMHDDWARGDLPAEEIKNTRLTHRRLRAALRTIERKMKK